MPECVVTMIFFNAIEAKLLEVRNDSTHCCNGLAQKSSPNIEEVIQSLNNDELIITS